MPTIAYRYHDALYLNITNRCPCDCAFCLRGNRDGVAGSGSLWLDSDPTTAEVIAAIQTYGDLSQFSEVVYCGFGEPFSSYDVMLDVARWLKDQSATLRVRVNTNGLGDLITGHPTAPELTGLIDALSISLNAPTPEEYVQLCNPLYGLDALPAVIAFAKEVKHFVPDVSFTVVDLLTDEQFTACKRIAKEAGIPLRARAFV